MVDTGTWVIIAAAAGVGAFFLGYLCKPFGLCPQAGGEPIGTFPSPFIGKGPSPGTPKNININTLTGPSPVGPPVAHHYGPDTRITSAVGYSSAPLTVA